jgi:aryl-alcohol dehydrogenase-like predicted oxidoreductase
MQYRQLGSTGAQVSELILGAWQFGKANWTDVDDDESIKTMHAAIDAGINMIDTAVAYGDGYSEEIVGNALKGHHDQCMVASKVDGNPGLIREMIDKALGRLQVDVVDLYQIHYPLPQYPVGEAVAAMEELRQAGKIRFIGVSNFSLEQMQEGLQAGRIDTCQPPYNILWRQYENDVIPFCADNDIAVIPYSSLAQGLLTGKFRTREDIPHDIRSNNKLFAEGVFEKSVQVVNLMDEIADRHDKTPAQVAIAWTLQAPGITAPIIGARNRRQLIGNLDAVGLRLSQDEWDQLSEAGLKVSEQLDFATNMWSWAPA